MNQIEQIKDILFSNEKRALDALTRRLEKRESRVADIADVLPESLGRSNVESDKLVQSLRAPVEKCLKDSIARDPQNFADALFPAIGPAIRKSIAETLKTFSESINQAIEEKTSIKSIRWRMQAKKAGIPYAQFLIQKKLEYRVEHAYLIQTNSGLLIADAHRPDAIRKDDEAISAMLTAIQDFVSESFGGGDEGTLNTADVGEYTLWTMRGPHAMLACVINGTPPRGLRDTFIENLEGIHMQFPEVLEHFDGQKNAKTLMIEPLLEDCLLQQAIAGQEKPKKQSMGIFKILLLIGLLAGLAWLGWQKFESIKQNNFLNKQMTSLVSSLEQESGIFLTASEIKKNVIHIRGLRDNSAKQTDALLKELEIDSKDVDIKFTPFHSLEKDILDKRIVNKLNIPADISYELTGDGKLIFDGEITPEFMRNTQSKLQNMLGINSIDFVLSDKIIEANANNIFGPPDTLKLNVSSGVLVLNGNAPYSWYKKLDADLISQVEGLTSKVDESNFSIAELVTIQEIETELKNHKVMFAWTSGFKEGEIAKLPALADKLIVYGEAVERLGLEPKIILTGFTDQIGTPERNLNILSERAYLVLGHLNGLKVTTSWLEAVPGNIEGNPNESDPSLRRVEISFNTNLDRFKNNKKEL